MAIVLIYRGNNIKKSGKQSVIATFTIKVELWYALKPQFMYGGCENLSQGFGLSTLIIVKPLRIYGEILQLSSLEKDNKYWKGAKHIK